MPLRQDEIVEVQVIARQIAIEEIAQATADLKKEEIDPIEKESDKGGTE